MALHCLTKLELSIVFIVFGITTLSHFSVFIAITLDMEKDKCTSSKAVYRKWGSCDHISDSCNEVEKCVKCGGGHNSTSWECSTFLEEVEIIKIKIDRGVSYPEVKNFFLRSSLLPGNGYAAAATTGSSKVVSPCESKSLGT